MNVWGPDKWYTWSEKLKLRMQTDTEQFHQLISPAGGWYGGFAGRQHEVLQQKQGEGALHDCRDPRVTEGGRLGLGYFFSHPQGNKREREGKSDNNNFLHLWRAEKLCSPDMSCWAVSPLWDFYLMPDWLFAWFLVIRSLPAHPEEKLCL